MSQPNKDKGQTYLFESERLRFRAWTAADVSRMAEINSDAEVMEFFPATQSVSQTSNFVDRMIDMQNKRGYCYFATEVIDSGELIGFIGMAYQDYEAPFTPCVDIGWRLNKKYWNCGYATEGARRCLRYGFEELKLDRIYSIAVESNIKSIKVMKKLGMTFYDSFTHPALKDIAHLRDCAVYCIEKNEIKQ